MNSHVILFFFPPSVSSSSSSVPPTSHLRYLRMPPRIDHPAMRHRPSRWSLAPPALCCSACLYTFRPELLLRPPPLAPCSPLAPHRPADMRHRPPHLPGPARHRTGCRSLPLRRASLPAKLGRCSCPRTPAARLERRPPPPPARQDQMITSTRPIVLVLNRLVSIPSFLRDRSNSDLQGINSTHLPL